MDEIDRAQMYDERLRANAEQAAVVRARRALQLEPGYVAAAERCRGCGDTIPVARRHAMPSAVHCLSCATAAESTSRHYARAAR